MEPDLGEEWVIVPRDDGGEVCTREHGGEVNNEDHHRHHQGATGSKRQYQRRKLGRNLLRWRKLVRLMRFFMRDIDGGSMFRVRDYEALNEEK